MMSIWVQPHTGAAPYLYESAAWMIEAAQGQQVALQHAQGFIHMQPMKVNLLESIQLISSAAFDYKLFAR